MSDFSLDDIIVTDLVEDVEVLKRETEVVEAEYIQIEDYIDEVSRSKKGYISAKHKNIIQKEADNFITLKYITIGVNQDDNTFYVKRKTDKYNPLLTNILKQDYNNKRFIPIVHDSIKLYEQPTQTETTHTLVTEQPTEGIYDNKYFVKNFDDELNKIYKLNIQYDENTSDNYSYYNKLSDINNLIQPEFPFTTITSGYVREMANDTFVLRNCSDDSPCSLSSEDNIKIVKYDGKKLIGAVNNYDIKNNIIVVEKGQQHNIVGFLSIPTRYLFKLNNFQCSLNINETTMNHYTKGITQILNEYEKEIKISYINTSLDFDLKDLDINNEIHLLLLPDQKLEDLDEIYENLNYILANNSHTDIIELFAYYVNNDIMNLNYTIKELDIFLSTFNLELNDLTYDYWIEIKRLIQNNINSINKERETELKKLKHLIENYNTNLDAINKEIFKKDYKLISNKDIDFLTDKVVDEYAKYFTDNTETRLRWYLENQYRSDILYLVKIQQYIEQLKTKLDNSLEHFFDDINKSAKSLDEQLQSLEDDNETIAQNIEKLEEQIRTKTKTDICFKIRKKYSSMDALKSDNRKSGISYDDNLQVTGSDNIVKVGDYALLDIQGVKKYFKRDLIGSKNVEMWIVVDKLEYRTECNESNTEDLRLTPKCLFNEQDDICESRPIVILKLKLEENKRIIQNINAIRELLSSNKLGKLSALIEYKLRLFNNNIKQINRNNDDKYKETSKLLEKYKTEHDSLEMHTNTNYLINNASEETFEFITDEGYDADGRMIITRAVINEKQIKPTTSVFTDVVLDADIQREYMISNTNTNDEQTDNKFSINNILRTFIKILNITISGKEFTKIVTDTENFKNIYKISLTNFSTNLKKIKKFKNVKKTLLKRIYNKYTQKYSIIWTATRLLITLQTAIPNIEIRNTIKSCKMNIFGYPLVEEGKEQNMAGIDFMTCILNILKDSGGYWVILKENVYNNCSESSKKCETITEAINKALSYLYTENYNIRKLYIDKRHYLNTISITAKKPWKTFRPPLEIISKINKKPSIITKDTIISSNFSSETINQFKILNYWSSLNIIYSIDHYIAKQSTENILYNPTPLNNSCCLYKIDNDYSSINYYKSKNDNINTLDTNKYILKDIQNLIEERKGTYFKILSSEKENREYSRYNFSEWEEDDELIEDFYLNFVEDGFFMGRKQIYDKSNVSTLTGNTKDDIRLVVHTSDDKRKLEDIVNKRNIFNVEINEEDHNILSTINKIRDSNSLLKKNGYFNTFFKLFTTYIENNTDSDEITITREKDKLWDIIGNFIDNIIKKINKKISTNLDSSESSILLKNLANLGNFKQTYNENVTLYKNTEANYIRSKTKDNFIKYYTLNTLRTIVNKIVNDGIHALSRSDLDGGNIIGDIPNLFDLLDNINLKLGFEQEKFTKEIYSEYTTFKIYNEEHKATFIDISNKLAQLLNFIDKITSKESISNCNDTIINSLFDSSDSNFLLEFLFYVIIQTILNIEDDDLPSFIPSSEEISLDDFDESEDTLITTDDDKIRCEFLNDFLKFVIEHQNKLDYLTQKNIEKTIEQREEELKDKNLQTYKDLNKEARLIQKELLRHKLDKWSNLATKERSQFQFQTDDDPFSPSNEVHEHIQVMEQTNVRYVGEEDDDIEW